MHTQLGSTRLKSASAAQDNSDAQYRTFRTNLPLLCLLAFALLSLKHLCLKLLSSRSTSPSSASRRTDTREPQIPLTTILSLIFLWILHGANTLKILIIMGVSYTIAKGCGTTGRGTPVGPVLTWAWSMGLLFAAERYDGFEGGFGRVHPMLGILVRPTVPFSFQALDTLCLIRQPAECYHEVGRYDWRVCALVYPFQLFNASSCLLQYGLLLGVKSKWCSP